MNRAEPMVGAGMLEHLRRWAAGEPGRPAYAFAGCAITYGQLQEQVDEMATALLSCGLRPGDRVAILSTPRPEAWVSFLATISIGGVWVGLNPRYRTRELTHILGNCRPRIVLGLRGDGCDDLVQVLAAQPGAQDRAPVLFDDLDELTARLRQAALTGPVTGGDLDARRSALDPGRPALIVYTSGSTGAPKGAVLSDRGIAASFEIEARHQAVNPVRTIANLPINHIAGMGDLCCTPLVAGGMIVFQEHFDASAMLEAIERFQITVLMQVPTTLKLLVEHPDWASADVSSLQAVHWGGAALPRAAMDAYRARGIRLGTTYGMTEITGSVTYSDTDADQEVLEHTVGRPITQMDMRLIDDDGRPVPAGAAGEIIVRHPGLMLEYFDAPEATRASFGPDGFFHTGDVGALREDGNLSLVGRKKEMYKSGGENIYPREIEQVLEAHPGVRMAVVVPAPDPDFQEVGVAYCETAPGTGATPGVLRDWCRTRMANYKVPKAFVATAELPRLAVGKLDKQQLIARAPADLAAARATPDPALGNPARQP